MTPNLDLCDKVKSKANPGAPTRDDLVKECKKHGLRYSGTKKELCDRLKAARRTSASGSASSGSSSSSSRSSGGSFAHLRKHNPKALTNERANAEMDAVTFRGSKYGDVDLFRGILTEKLGKNWEKAVLSVKTDLSTVPGIQRLGIPGRQGTVIKLTHGGKAYAVKVTRPGVRCGDGYAASQFGFLKQARIQQIVSRFGLTVPVHAVFCGNNLPSFVVMDTLHKRVFDIYKTPNRTPTKDKPYRRMMSTKHQNQYWDIMHKLDTVVGVHFNDHNCLNLMTDSKGDLKLIDFDRSHLITWTKYLNAKYGNGRFLTRTDERFGMDIKGQPNKYDMRMSTCHDSNMGNIAMPLIRERSLKMFPDEFNKENWDRGSRGVLYLGQEVAAERRSARQQKERAAMKK